MTAATHSAAIAATTASSQPVTAKAQAVKPPAKKRRRFQWKSSFWIANLLRIAMIAAMLAAWQIAADQGAINAFLMGSPAGIYQEAVRLMETGQLWQDTYATVEATLIGFLVGSLSGAFCGLLLWCFPYIARILDPFFVALNGLPKIALAPMIIIWFGSGMLSKVALAFVATFIVSLLSAYQGTHQIDSSLVNLMRSLGATQRLIFLKLVIPATLPWIIASFRLNIGFALIAEIGGEFIASDKGLGRMIFVSGNLFNLNAVWVGIMMLMLVAVTLYALVARVEKNILPWNSK
ncbi:ABC transporter permease [Comamonas antarctica]|uniref:ABC transporter permease n=1 Tax=Comamonas antarctica TaxID=2743470 RepID=A0A6N1XAZ9_9BURK|nr:ABC transporter permease [Comamonas antarctica]QKV55262.1 ABC transporter permease [Comamonas antarctica]